MTTTTRRVPDIRLEYAYRGGVVRTVRISPLAICEAETRYDCGYWMAFAHGDGPGMLVWMLWRDAVRSGEVTADYAAFFDGLTTCELDRSTLPPPADPTDEGDVSGEPVSGNGTEPHHPDPDHDDDGDDPGDGRRPATFSQLIAWTAIGLGVSPADLLSVPVSVLEELLEVQARRSAQHEDIARQAVHDAAVRAGSGRS